MAKKRKTRNQKEKASQKSAESKPAKQQPQKVPADKSVKTAETTKKSEKKVTESSTGIDAAADQSHADRMRTMRWSLIVFVVLIAIQFLIWVLEYFDVITLDLIEV